ncbi:FAD-dependent oxidoreductase [Pleionea litopenaei]|uniref:FAD-dependent oxidoreductase n=1 Tax=Pleionea litopenaei TaxID=3070815 RepID=A0AA51X6Q6_9GAMM|nr:FAD-dependent oxidoreductase [Pleionea sp. HL-JVS1]WMS87086.1 FAD-dependent oxidoreductase [Pleionea sp. HL-JVS1]
MGEHRPLFEFVDLQREEPEKQVIEVRKHEFAEIYRSFKQPGIKEQSSRCIACGNPYCQWKCPVHNYIPDWLSLAAEGKYIEAAELSHQTNSLPEVCGRVCPQDRLCEQACTLNNDFGAVTIGQVEKFITDNAFAQGWRPDVSKAKPQPYKVAVVGAGPAGLACADVLIRNGVQVTVFDRYPEIGGLLTFGIPEFKLEKQVMTKRREIFESMGIEFKLGVEIGRDLSFETLNQDYDKVFLGLGTYKTVAANLGEGVDQGVHKALDYLIANTCHLHDYPVETANYIDFKDQDVIVLGGGDTAMDCVRTAIRQGAKRVRCVYRKDQEAMPGSRKEFKHATEEGVEFVWHHQAESCLRDESGALTGLHCHNTADNSKATLECDAVIVAYGFRGEQPEWLKTSNVTFNQWQLVETSEHQGYRTQDKNIYAGGDMVRGADLVVTAIAEGRQAAESICRDLGVLV